MLGPSKHFPADYDTADEHGNLEAVEGCDQCECGSKYWEFDECIDCGSSIAKVRAAEAAAEALIGERKLRSV